MASRTLQQQVRAREMDYERQQAQKLKEKKEKKRQKLVDRLNELWREEQEARIEALAEECAIALRCIGQSHAAAALFVQKQEALKMDRHRQAVLNQHRESSRFKTALQKERVRRKLESDPLMVAKRRKNVKDSAAQWERSLGRYLSHKAKFRLLSRGFSGGVPGGWLAEHKEDLSLLQPSDYKHTFLHSRLFMNTDDGNCSSKDKEMDAWKAAEVQRQLVNSYRNMQMQIRNVMDKRKFLRGQLAGSQLMIEKKVQLLEHENLAFEKVEKEVRKNISHHQDSETMSKAHPQCMK
ncbi:hypothetical protein GOP47_0022616 [Adiantum capillus-veneris]|uniref:Uncharacterized protein n=1 Tax=Adiantum capillus-veneris TaxID=13818 RepID=A0A9D4Z672_ADICA|nr:hypothetical protein GOP47_0022616 [Adiantum capillus-veneris]